MIYLTSFRGKQGEFFFGGKKMFTKNIPYHDYENQDYVINQFRNREIYFPNVGPEHDTFKLLGTVIKFISPQLSDKDNDLLDNALMELLTNAKRSKLAIANDPKAERDSEDNSLNGTITVRLATNFQRDKLLLSIINEVAYSKFNIDKIKSSMNKNISKKGHIYDIFSDNVGNNYQSYTGGGGAGIVTTRKFLENIGGSLSFRWQNNYYIFQISFDYVQPKAASLQKVVKIKDFRPRLVQLESVFA